MLAFRCLERTDEARILVPLGRGVSNSSMPDALQERADKKSTLLHQVTTLMQSASYTSLHLY
ncbi:hypothetical protein [Scytonema sp. HK-05]|uniref:hypothetical protein n=1 Tax=Scytonema sp. HK-05 TaxID=1137095 RepID=UPI001161305F|nr:hypothetical protein [Scytonema sp. HK-05]